MLSSSYSSFDYIQWLLAYHMAEYLSCTPFIAITALSRTNSSKAFCLVYSLAVFVADDKIQWFVAKIWAEEQSCSSQKLKKFMIKPLRSNMVQWVASFGHMSDTDLLLSQRTSLETKPPNGSQNHTALKGMIPQPQLLALGMPFTVSLSSTGLAAFCALFSCSTFCFCLWWGFV